MLAISRWKETRIETIWRGLGRRDVFPLTWKVNRMKRSRVWEGNVQGHADPF